MGVVRALTGREAEGVGHVASTRAAGGDRVDDRAHVGQRVGLGHQGIVGGNHHWVGDEQLGEGGAEILGPSIALSERGGQLARALKVDRVAEVHGHFLVRQSAASPCHQVVVVGAADRLLLPLEHPDPPTRWVLHIPSFGAITAVLCSRLFDVVTVSGSPISELPPLTPIGPSRRAPRLGPLQRAQLRERTLFACRHRPHRSPRRPRPDPCLPENRPRQADRHSDSIRSRHLPQRSRVR